jgi:predicted NBD/HSP70 family sugar kinase
VTTAEQDPGRRGDDEPRRPQARREAIATEYVAGVLVLITGALGTAAWAAAREQPLLLLAGLSLILAALSLWAVARARRAAERARIADARRFEAEDELEGREQEATRATAQIRRLEAELAATGTARAPARPWRRPVPIDAKRILGIDLGRRWMTFGILELPEGDGTHLPRRLPAQGRDQAASPLLGIARYGAESAYTRIIDDAVVKAASNWPGRIDGIAVGVPGQVRIKRGELLGSPGAFPEGTMFVSDLAEQIGASVDCKTYEGPDGAPLSELGRAGILIDNDVRCAVRRVLSRWRGDPGWHNFACVFIGGGVGAGVVIERDVYYGRHRMAGEVGHMTVDVSATGDERDPGVHDLSRCPCGRAGLHWEQLVNGPGLERLAVAVDDGAAAALAGAFTPDGDPEPPTAPTAYQITLAARMLDGPTPHPSAAAEAVTFIDDLGQTNVVTNPIRAAEKAAGVLERAGMGDYVRTVRDQYARYLAVGLANISTVIDLDHIVLGGGVMDALWPQPDFRRSVTQWGSAHALRPAWHENLLVSEPGGRPGWAWEGAALMFADPTYAAIRGGSPEDESAAWHASS